MTATIANQYVVLYIITLSCSLIVLQKIQTHTDTHAHVSLFWQFRKSHHVQYLHANYNVYIINIKQWSVDNKKTEHRQKNKREERRTLDFTDWRFRFFSIRIPSLFPSEMKKSIRCWIFFFIFFLLNYNYRDGKIFSRKKKSRFACAFIAGHFLYTIPQYSNGNNNNLWFFCNNVRNRMK